MGKRRCASRKVIRLIRPNKQRHKCALPLFHCCLTLDSSGKEPTHFPQAAQAASRTGQLSSLKQSTSAASNRGTCGATCMQPRPSQVSTGGLPAGKEGSGPNRRLSIACKETSCTPDCFLNSYQRG
eukprot:7214731-Pyramimonas_sp.AAC.1